MDPSTKARILMCPPDYFGIEYEINPWMNVQAGSDPELARRQWQSLHQTLVELGVGGRAVEPVPRPARPGFHGQRGPGLPGPVPPRAVPVRRAPGGEPPLRGLGARPRASPIVPLPEGMNFEGAGDALFCGDTLFAGYRFRSDVRSHQWVGERLGVPVLPMELVDPRFYHLDTCFCPLAPDLAIYYPGAFDEYGRSVSSDRIPRLVEVSPEEAISFSCNAVVVGRTVILNQGRRSLPPRSRISASRCGRSSSPSSSSPAAARSA